MKAASYRCELAARFHGSRQLCAGRFGGINYETSGAQTVLAYLTVPNRGDAPARRRWRAGARNTVLRFPLDL